MTYQNDDQLSHIQESYEKYVTICDTVVLKSVKALLEKQSFLNIVPPYNDLTKSNFLLSFINVFKPDQAISS